MAIVDSLKKLLVKFGGNPSALEENATSSDVIDAITEAYTDKEGTYTEVTPISSEGTKIATITTNNTAHDIYAPKELPAVTAEDEGDVLGVNSSGEWVKTNVPSELPDAYNHIRIVNRESSFSGAWTKDTSDPTEIVFTGSLDTSKFKAYGRKPFGAEVDITNDFGSNQDLCNYPNTTIEFDFDLSGLKITVIPISSMNKIRKGSLQLSGSFKYVGAMYDPVAKNYGIMGEVSITFSSDFSTVTITVST